MKNMTIADLKEIIKDLPNDIPVIIPVVDEYNCNRIFSFRFVRTAGLLSDEGEEYQIVLCLNGAVDGNDIADQVHFSGKDVGVEKILFGNSKYDTGEKE